MVDDSGRTYNGLGEQFFAAAQIHLSGKAARHLSPTSPLRALIVSVGEAVAEAMRDPRGD